MKYAKLYKKEKFIHLKIYFINRSFPLTSYLSFQMRDSVLVNNIFYSVRFIISLVKVLNIEVILHISDKYMTKCTLV